MTIAITGASGGLGRATVESVLQTARPSEVVLTTRRPDALAEFTARGVDVRRADFAEPASLNAAFAGVDRLLLISTDTSIDMSRLDLQRDAISAAAAAGVRHIIYTSVPEPVPENPALAAPDHAGTEQALRDSGLLWTMLRNNLYTHMRVPGIKQAIGSGRFVTNGGGGAAAYVTREDCAAAAAAVLANGGHEGQVYDVTGPAALTAADLVALARESSGREVQLVLVDDAAYSAGLRAAGMPVAVTDLVTSLGAAVRDGFFANVSTAVADLTGRQPTALRDVALSA